MERYRAALVAAATARFPGDLTRTKRPNEKKQAIIENIKWK